MASAMAGLPGVPQNEALPRSQTLQSLQSMESSWGSPVEESEEEEQQEDAESRMRRMFASRGSESLELFEQQAAELKTAQHIYLVPKVPIVDSMPFVFSMGLIVIVNAILIGIETDYAGAEPSFFVAANLVFLIFYMAELGIRFATFGSAVFTDLLTVLDMVLVVLVFIEQFAFPGSFARSLPAFRLIRLLRLLRTLRYLKSSPQLMAFISNAWRILKTLSWVSACLLLLLWAVAACMHHVIGKSGEWNDTYDPWQDYEPFEAFNNREYFGTFAKSLLTSFQVVTNAQWANHVGRPVAFQYPLTAAFWFFFLLVTTFGLVVCVVANIVQDALETSRVLETSSKDVARENRQNAGIKARTLLRMIDEDGDGELTQEELAAALHHEEFVHMLYSFEVPVMDAESLVRLFDKKGKGCVTFDALVTGLVSMLDDIDNKDWVFLSIWSEALHLRADTVEQKCEMVLQVVLRLKRALEHMEMALRQFMGSQEKTVMFYKAMAYVRSAPPPVPASVLEVLNIKVREKIPEPEHEAFIAFARRYIGPSQRILPPKEKPPPVPFPDVAKSFVNRRAVLPEAPMPPDIYKAMYKKEEAERLAYENRFEVDGKLGQTSKTFKDLKKHFEVAPELLE